VEEQPVCPVFVMEKNLTGIERYSNPPGKKTEKTPFSAGLALQYRGL
jgi:hypothetical protein